MHHFALLIGYGAGAVNPYLAFETIARHGRQGLLPGVDAGARGQELHQGPRARASSRSMSKMGISTIQSYRGAQIFEAIGLDRERHRPVLHRHALAHRRHRPGRDRRGGAPAPRARLPAASRGEPTLDVGRPVPVARATASTTCSTRETIHKLQHACRTGDYARFKEYSRAGQRAEPRSSARCAACSSSSPRTQPVPLDEVEPVEAIVKRFKTGRDVLRLDQQGGPRDAGHRHEPHRRQEQHRRGRRGPGALRARAERRLAQQRDQAGGLGALRRDQPLPGQRATSCRSRWRRAPSPARAASCPGTRSTRGSPRCATRRPAWA